MKQRPQLVLGILIGIFVGGLVLILWQRTDPGGLASGLFRQTGFKSLKVLQADEDGSLKAVAIDSFADDPELQTLNSRLRENDSNALEEYNASFVASLTPVLLTAGKTWGNAVSESEYVSDEISRAYAYLYYLYTFAETGVQASADNGTANFLIYEEDAYPNLMSLYLEAREDWAGSAHYVLEFKFTGLGAPYRGATLAIKDSSGRGLGDVVATSSTDSQSLVSDIFTISRDPSEKGVKYGLKIVLDRGQFYRGSVHMVNLYRVD